MKEINKIFLITIDSLRFDVFQKLLNESVLPTFSKLLKNSIFCTNAFSNAPYTKASFPAILTGTHPFAYGPYDNLNKRILISEILKKEGYFTVGIPNNSLVSSLYGYNRGFDVFLDPWKFLSPTKNKIRVFLKTKFRRLFKVAKFVNTKISNILSLLNNKVPYVKGEDITILLLNYLERNVENKFFGWIHYMDTHLPYYPPQEFLEKSISKLELYKLNRKAIKSVRKPILKNDELEKIKELYIAEIRYLDFILDRFIEKLKEFGILNKSLLIITADHGEEFLDHGAIGHTGINYKTHMYDELLRVPLIFYSPKLKRKEINYELDSVCITPTILDILKIKSGFIFEGKSILKIKENKPILAEASLYNKHVAFEKIKPNEKRIIAFRKDGIKIIIEDKQSKELYDTNKDPFERNNLIYNKKIKKEILDKFKSYQEILEDIRLLNRKNYRFQTFLLRPMA